MVASLEKGIVTTPTLFGLDPHELVKDLDPEAMTDLCTRKEKEQDREKSANQAAAALNPSSTNYKGNVTFTHYDDVNSLIENTSGEQHIRGLSSFAWIQADHNRYILSSSTGSYLTIKIEERKFLAIYTQKIPVSPDTKPRKQKAPYMRPIVLATTSTFEDAVHAADTYAKKKFVVPMILTNAPWRRYPATSQQIAFLNKFREEGKKLEPGSITKGRAADWITKIKHGARGRFKRMHSETAKVQRKQQKHERWEEMQRRAQVRVGPVED
jgi:ATP-dependent helicase IRC3